MKLSETCGCGASFSVESSGEVDNGRARADLKDWREQHKCPAVGRGSSLATTQIGFRSRSWDRIEDAR